MKLTRRGLLGAASGAAAAVAFGKPAGATAEFEFKLGVNTAGHPPPDDSPDRGGTRDSERSRPAV